MAETTKKAKAPSKAKKSEAVKAETVSVEAPKAETAKKSKAKKAEAEVSAPAPIRHEDVAQLAHRYWAERGHQHGQHVDDWFRAEQELRGKAS